MKWLVKVLTFHIGSRELAASLVPNLRVKTWKRAFDMNMRVRDQYT